MTRSFSVAVVGGGPAGTAAALWIARYRRRVVVFDSGEGRNRWADEVHGYLGADPLSPHKLLARASADLAQYEGVLRVEGEVAAVARSDGCFRIETTNEEYEADRVVLATGVEDEFPDVGGFLEHYGASAFHCSSCDGYQARGKGVVVLGWGAHVAGFALGLLDWAASVAILTEGHDFEGSAEERARLAGAGVAVVEDDAVELVGSRGALSAVRTSGGRELACELVFFSIAHRPRNSLARSLGCRLDEDDLVVVDSCARTNVEGVYAAGDITPGLQLVQIAAAEGATAGVQSALSIDLPAASKP